MRRKAAPGVHSTSLRGGGKLGVLLPLALVYSDQMPTAPPVVLTIAGFDPSSGAGITADIKVIAAQECYGVACITALTVQSTQGVARVEAIDPEVIAASLEMLISDFAIGAVHIGMLANEQVVGTVADFLDRSRLPHVVLDPILKSSSGADLLNAAGTRVMIERLFPLAELVTPNLDEAAALASFGLEKLLAGILVRRLLFKWNLRDYQAADTDIHTRAHGLVAQDDGLGVVLVQADQRVRAEVPLLGVNLHVMGLAPPCHQLCHLGNGLVVREEREDPPIRDLCNLRYLLRNRRRRGNLGVLWRQKDQIGRASCR